MISQNCQGSLHKRLERGSLCYITKWATLGYSEGIYRRMQLERKWASTPHLLLLVAQIFLGYNLDNDLKFDYQNYLNISLTLLEFTFHENHLKHEDEGGP